MAAEAGGGGKRRARNGRKFNPKAKLDPSQVKVQRTRAGKQAAGRPSAAPTGERARPRRKK